MSEFNISVLIMRDNVIISGEIYTTGKNFTLLPTVTAVTNITSGIHQERRESIEINSVIDIGIWIVS